MQDSENVLPHTQTHFQAVELIVSGGQTGADRAALDWAIQHHIPHGGWCPLGRRADEELPIDNRYQLKETPSSDYAQRTEWNVRDSDGTVIFSIAPNLVEGSDLTKRFAEQYHRPYIHIHKAYSNPAVALLQFLEQHDVHVLNIAGPRASTEPEIGAFVTEILDLSFMESITQREHRG